MPSDLPEARLDIPLAVCLDLAREQPPAARRPGYPHTRSWPATPPPEDEA
ncbi:MAG: hypothetical protein ACRERE_27455 [Candidatus Entotheonellia bacterium]